MEAEQNNLKNFKLLNEIKEKLERIKLGDRKIETTIQWLWDKKLCHEFEDYNMNLLDDKKRNKIILNKILRLKENDEYKFSQWIFFIEKELKDAKSINATEEKRSWESLQRNLDLENICELKSAPNLERINIIDNTLRSSISWITESIRDLYRLNAEILIEMTEKLNYKEEIEFLKKELEGKLPKNLILEEEPNEEIDEKRKNKKLIIVNIKQLLKDMEAFRKTSLESFKRVGEFINSSSERFKDLEEELNLRTVINKDLLENNLKMNNCLKKFENEWKKMTKWKLEGEGDRKEMKNLKKIVDEGLIYYETIIKRFENYIKTDYEKSNIEQRVNLIERDIKWFMKKFREQDFQIKKEIGKNNFFSGQSFLPVLVMNMRKITKTNDKKINANEREKKALNKINWILKSIIKWKPLLVVLIDIGLENKKENLELNIKLENYENYFTKDLQNLILIHKSLNLKVECLGNNALIIDEKIICVYYKPEKKNKYFNFLLNNLTDLIIIGDLNFRSHNILKKESKKKIFKKKNYKKLRECVLYEFKNKYKSFYEEEVENALCIANTRFSEKKKRKIIKMPKDISDHDMLFMILKGYWKKNLGYNLYRKESRVISKFNANKYSKMYFNTVLYNDENNFQKNIKILEEWKETKKKYSNLTKKNVKNVKLNEKRIENRKKNINEIIKEINSKMESVNPNKFKTLKKLMKYSSREKFEGVYLKNELIDQFINIGQAIEIKVNDENKNKNYIKNLIEFLVKEIEKMTENNEYMDRFKNSFKLYYKTYSEALDINQINVHIVNKIWKNFMLKLCNKEFELKEPIDKYIKIGLGITKRLLMNQKLEFKTFYLNKNKNINSIDNYRIISICPVGIKFFEQFIYSFTDDFLEENILNMTNKAQFGFLKGRNCQMAIQYLKENKINGITIALDIYRAYEYVNLKILKNWLLEREEEITKDIEKTKIIDIKNVLKSEKLSCKFLLLWLNLIDTCKLNMNGRLIKQKQGVPMGSKLSPKIFNLYTAIMFENFIKEYVIEKKICILVQFADDAILRIKWNYSLNILNEIYKIYKSFGLKINEKKCEILIKKKLSKYNIMQWKEILMIKENYDFNLVYNLRYLGKWLKIGNNEEELETGKDLYKEIGRNIYFNQLEWTKKLEMIHLFIISKRRYLLESEENEKKIKEMIKAINGNLKSIRFFKINTYIETMMIMNYIKIIMRKKLGYNNLLHLRKKDIIYELLNLTLNISDWNITKGFGKVLFNIKEIVEKQNNEEKSEEEESLDSIKIKKKNYEEIVINRNNLQKNYYIIINEIIKLCNNENNKILSVFLWNKELNKLDVSNVIFKYDGNEILKNNKTIFGIVFLIYCMTIKSVSKESQEKKIELICDNIDKIINDTKWRDKFYFNNEAFEKNMKDLFNYNRVNFIDEIEQIPDIVKYEKEFEFIENKEIELIEKNKINLINEAKKSDNLKEIIEKIKKFKEEIKGIELINNEFNTRIEFAWKKIIKEKKEWILKDISNDTRKYVKIIKEEWELFLKKITDYKDLEILIRKEIEWFDKIENLDPWLKKLEKKKEIEKKIENDKELNDEELNIDKDNWLEKLVHKELILIKYANNYCNYDIVKKIIKCINMTLNKKEEWKKMKEEERIRTMNDEEEMKKFFEEIKEEWKNWKELKLVEVREKNRKNWYRKKYLNDAIMERRRLKDEEILWRRALKK